MKKIVSLFIVVILVSCASKKSIYSEEINEPCQEMPLRYGIYHGTDTSINLQFEDDFFKIGYSDSLGNNFFKTKEMLVFNQKYPISGNKITFKTK